MEKKANQGWFYMKKNCRMPVQCRFLDYSATCSATIYCDEKACVRVECYGACYLCEDCMQQFIITHELVPVPPEEAYSNE
jgi:hypothetical protein